MKPESYELFLSAQPKLYRFALSLTKDKHNAKDIYQETLLKLWQLRAEWGNWTSFEAYAMRMVRNAYLNQVKKQSSRMYVALEHHTEQPETSEMEKKMVIDDLKARFNMLIGKLPDIQRQVMYLREIEEMEYKEIAAVLEITAAQVKVYLFRGRQHIKASLYGKG